MIRLRLVFEHFLVEILERLVSGEENFADVIVQLVGPVEKGRIYLIGGDLSEILAEEKTEERSSTNIRSEKKTRCSSFNDVFFGSPIGNRRGNETEERRVNGRRQSG